jgi:hypothetical protein
MGFGILQSSNPSPPGTSILEAFDGSDKTAQIVLVPQPSTSPNNPLNWSRVRKEMLFVTIVFGTILTGVIGPVLVPGFTTVAAHFEVGLTQISLLSMPIKSK